MNPDANHRDLILKHMAKSKAKILVVDDNSGIRAALKVLLDMNFHTDINTGNEGLYWLSEIKKRTPDRSDCDNPQLLCCIR